MEKEKVFDKFSNYDWFFDVFSWKTDVTKFYKF